jgi:hypothetical protein
MSDAEKFKSQICVVFMFFFCISSCIAFVLFDLVLAGIVELQECDVGVISNILTLQAEVQLTDATYELARLLKSSVDVRPVFDLSGPDFELDKILKALAHAKGSTNDKNSFPTLLEQLSTEVDDDMLKVGRPRLNIGMDAQQIALSLEVKHFFTLRHVYK